MKKWEGDCCKVEGLLSRDRIRLALTSEWWGGVPPSVTLKVIDTTCGSETLHIHLTFHGFIERYYVKYYNANIFPVYVHNTKLECSSV